MAEKEKNKKIRGEEAMVSNNFPEDIIFDLLSKFPVKSLLSFRCVCKSWCALIDHPDFVKMHLTRSIATSSNLSIVCARRMRNEDGLTIISVDLDDCEQERKEVEVSYPFPSPVHNYVLISCNGLVYMFDSVSGFKVESPTFLLNPSTRKHKKLPYMCLYFPFNTHSAYNAAYGFGYDPTTEDYKVIRVLEYLLDDDDDADDINHDGFVVKVYSLSSNSWRRIEGIPSFRVPHHVGVFKNSAFHWVSWPKTTTVPTSSVIVSVDIKEDEYREMPLPDLVANDIDMTMTVGVLGEKHQLCLICVSFRVNVEVWVMKDYGVRDSWEKQFLIEQPCGFNNYIRPICYSKNGELLLETTIFAYGFVGDLLLYDPHKGSLSKLMSPALLKTVCIQSLVSLDTKDGANKLKKKEETEENFISGLEGSSCFLREAVSLCSCVANLLTSSPDPEVLLPFLSRWLSNQTVDSIPYFLLLAGVSNGSIAAPSPNMHTQTRSTQDTELKMKTNASG